MFLSLTLASTCVHTHKHEYSWRHKHASSQTHEIPSNRLKSVSVGRFSFFSPFYGRGQRHGNLLVFTGLPFAPSYPLSSKLLRLRRQLCSAGKYVTLSDTDDSTARSAFGPSHAPINTSGLLLTCVTSGAWLDQPHSPRETTCSFVLIFNFNSPHLSPLSSRFLSFSQAFPLARWILKTSECSSRPTITYAARQKDRQIHEHI